MLGIVSIILEPDAVRRLAFSTAPSRSWSDSISGPASSSTRGGSSWSKLGVDVFDFQRESA